MFKEPQQPSAQDDGSHNRYNEERRKMLQKDYLEAIPVPGGFFEILEQAVNELTEAELLRLLGLPVERLKVKLSTTFPGVLDLTFFDSETELPVGGFRLHNEKGQKFLGSLIILTPGAKTPRSLFFHYSGMQETGLLKPTHASVGSIEDEQILPISGSHIGIPNRDSYPTFADFTGNCLDVPLSDQVFTFAEPSYNDTVQYQVKSKKWPFTVAKADGHLTLTAREGTVFCAEGFQITVPEHLSTNDEVLAKAIANLSALFRKK